ncbi:MAG: right-handed parallel beta-helix repeat-containing protein [Thermoplasmata archaeon]|nr:MAG: right-handed parallel beta-helix repeat-containing protein [Thermoplasmata archaeon]
MFVVATLLVAMAPAVGTAGEDGWEPAETIVWAAGSSPIVLSESMGIDEDTRLVIEPGVEVRFDPDVGMEIRGHLLAQGTPDDPILFTSNTTGEVLPNTWADVRLRSESKGRLHQVEHAVFQGGDSALLVSSADALVQDCVFTLNRYGIIARGGTELEVRNCQFINNSVLGLEFEKGAGGMAVDCLFEDNVVGVFCFEGSAPLVADSVFIGNYHHASFAGGSNGTLRSCIFEDAIAEAYECYDMSSPLFVDVTIEGQDEDGIHIRNASHPRMVGGTPVSNLEVDSKDNASYVVALAWITVEVRSEEGKRLAGANVTIEGASGLNLSYGSTDDMGLLEDVLMSMYTVDSSGGKDRENPHTVTVVWRGHVETFVVDPRDLDNERVLTLRLDTSGPEPADWGFIPNVLILMAIAVVAIVLAWWYQSRR